MSEHFAKKPQAFYIMAYSAAALLQLWIRWKLHYPILIQLKLAKPINMNDRRNLPQLQYIQLQIVYWKSTVLSVEAFNMYLFSLKICLFTSSGFTLFFFQPRHLCLLKFSFSSLSEWKITRSQCDRTSNLGCGIHRSRRTFHVWLFFDLWFFSSYCCSNTIDCNASYDT